MRWNAWDGYHRFSSQVLACDVGAFLVVRPERVDLVMFWRADSHLRKRESERE